VSVLEWLDQQPAMQGRVVGCVTWQVFPQILNVGRSRFPLWVSGRHSRLDRVSPQLADIQRWMDDITTKSRDEHFDAFAFRAALDLIETHQPRLLYLALGEPDTWAHRRRYDNYLETTQRCDRFIREIWEKLQSLPRYRDSTTLIVTTDHGRGNTPQDWPNHGKNTPRSNETWVAITGPDTPALGERRDSSEVVSAQIAATVAKFLGEDYLKSVPAAAPPIAAFFPAGK
jgi:arylsulfatase A-like enzyme